jgi:hypothetical protein
MSWTEISFGDVLLKVKYVEDWGKCTSALVGCTHVVSLWNGIKISSLDFKLVMGDEFVSDMACDMQMSQQKLYIHFQVAGDRNTLVASSMGITLTGEIVH